MSLLLQANALPALISAVLWGGADFSGGMGVKHAGGSLRGALRVVLLSHISSLAVLLLIAHLRGDSFSHGAPLFWGLGAGIASGLSLTGFYIALSRRSMGVSAAISGLLAAAIPALVDMAAQGSPGALRIAGFLFAGAAIWLIAAAPMHPEAKASRATMALAIAAGAGFGVYFVCLKYAGTAGLILPMANSRMGSLTTCSLLYIVVTLKQRRANSRATDPSIGSAMQLAERFTRAAALWALATAVLDTTGNLLFIEATHEGRLDIAAVLASLYPASTILLAAWTLKEHPTRRQAIGMGIAAIAVAMISL